MPNPACVAYEAYREARNSDPSNAVYLIGWDYLPKTEKEAWWKVVRSLVKLTRTKGGAE